MTSFFLRVNNKFLDLVFGFGRFSFAKLVEVDGLSADRIVSDNVGSGDCI